MNNLGLDQNGQGVTCIREDFIQYVGIWRVNGLAINSNIIILGELNCHAYLTPLPVDPVFTFCLSLTNRLVVVSKILLENREFLH